MVEINPIKTKYNGIVFRSKLEAQWAKFFDSLSIDWSYETEGYLFSDGTKYLPDFYLTEQDVFFEVKGVMKEFDEQKIIKLVEYSNKPCFVGYPNGVLDLYVPELKLSSNCHNYCGMIVYCGADYNGKAHGFLSYDYNAGIEELSYLPKNFDGILQINPLRYDLSDLLADNRDFIEYWNKYSRIEV